MVLKIANSILVYLNEARSVDSRRRNIIRGRKATFPVDHRRDCQSIGETSIEREFRSEKGTLSAAADVRVIDGHGEWQILT